MNWYLTFAIVAAAMVIWAMVAISNSRAEATEKALWFLLVVVLPIVGPVVYYFMKFRD